MTCKGSECGRSLDDRDDEMERRQVPAQVASAGCCGGHIGHDTETDDQLKVGQRA